MPRTTIVPEVTIDLTPLGQVYTTEEVSRLLRVSQRTVQDWIRQGILPAVRYGQLLRVRHADLVAFGEVVVARPEGAA